jgi:hypothetical protein
LQAYKIVTRVLGELVEITPTGEHSTMSEHDDEGAAGG